MLARLAFSMIPAACGLRLGDVAALHHDVAPDRADQLDGLLRRVAGPRARAEHDPAAAGHGQALGKHQPDLTQAAGDDVGAVAAEDLSMFRRHHRATLPRARHVEHKLAGVLGRAHQPNRGGRLGQRVVSALRHWQRAIGGQPVHGVQQLPDLAGLVERHQRQIHIREGEVAPEREKPQPGVAVDVALADLDEPSTESE
jgi:hypothetical protein